MLYLVGRHAGNHFAIKLLGYQRRSWKELRRLRREPQTDGPTIYGILLPLEETREL